MYVFSLESQDKLETCCPDLKRLYNEVIKYRDCKVLYGRREKAEQDRLFKEGKSKVNYPRSKHNRFLSQAADVSPYPIPDNWGEISWELIPIAYRKQIQREFKERCKFYNFNGYVKGTADQLGIDIRQGHDWDSDNEFNDQTFDDLVHTETVEE